MFRNGILGRSFVKMFKRILRSSIPFLKVYCILSLHLLRVVIFPHVDIKLMLVLYTINKITLSADIDIKIFQRMCRAL